MPFAVTRLSARSAVLTLMVCVPASAACAARWAASAAAADALSAALPASIAAFLLFSSVSRLRPAAVFRHAVEKSATPAAQAHTDSRRLIIFIDDPPNVSLQQVP